MPQNIPNMRRNISEMFGTIGAISVRYRLPRSDLVISHSRLYLVVLCLFVSFCYRPALPVATELFASVNFFWLHNALVRRCYLGYATLLTGSAM